MFSELGSLLLITGQQTASQGHELCVVAEQRAFSPESVRLSVREREKGGEGEKASERETICCGHWALIAVARLGTKSAQALSSDKERESISCQWAWQRGTGWCFFMEPAHTSWDSSLQTPAEWEALGRCPAAFTGVCHLPVNCQVLPIPSVPHLRTKATTWTKSAATQRSEQWLMD